MPQEAFFGSEDGRLSYREVVQARRLCASCPVMVDCLVDSFRYQETHGIWAGVTGSERSRLAVKHRDVDQAVREALRLIAARNAMDKRSGSGTRKSRRTHGIDALAEGKPTASQAA